VQVIRARVGFTPRNLGCEPKTIWLLKLELPICVDEDKAQPDLTPKQKNLREVQLVLNSE
jgi:hypothetical protein